MEKPFRMTAAPPPRIAPLRIGSLELAANLFLSPLAGYTNLPFRLLIREIGGAGLCTTDLVNARSLLENNRKAIKLIETRPADSPLAVQIFGAAPGEMRDAAMRLEQLGTASVDINMGCPAPKVCKVGGGSAMMLDTRAAASLVATVASAVKIPVTCKMRLGWDDTSLTAPDLARALADAGAAAIFVHGRTRAQGFSGRVNLDGIRAVVEAAPSVPVIGNGDVTTPEAARAMMSSTGCAGVSVGRGAFYNPWLFLEIAAWINDSRHLPPPSDDARFDAMRRHLLLMTEIFGETQGCIMFRKIAPWHVRLLGPTHEFNTRVHHLASLAQFDEILAFYRAWRAQFLDADGRILPKYRPAPVGASFLEPGTGAPIPVPKGTVDYW